MLLMHEDLRHTSLLNYVRLKGCGVKTTVQKMDYKMSSFITGVLQVVIMKMSLQRQDRMSAAAQNTQLSL